LKVPESETSGSFYGHGLFHYIPLHKSFFIGSTFFLFGLPSK